MSVISATIPKHGDRMSFAEFKALNLPEASSLSLLNGIVFDEADPGQDESMTKRNRQHARVESRLSFLLHAWRDRTDFSCGIFSGEVGCEVPERALDVGIDVAIFSAETLATQGDSLYIQGLPLLAVARDEMDERLRGTHTSRRRPTAGTFTAWAPSIQPGIARLDFGYILSN